MKRLKLLSLLLLLVTVSSVKAQTTVNLQVVDTPDTQQWINGTWTATLQMQPGAPPPSGPFVILAGGGSTATQNGSLNNTGSATISLPANANIAPAQTIWSFIVCSQATYQCYQSFVSVGIVTPQMTTIAPPSIRINWQTATPPVRAYQDTEIVGASLGATYYNLTIPTQKICTIAPNNNCTTWVATGSGGATPASPAGSTQFSNATNTGLASASNGGNSIGVNNITTPTQFNIPMSSCIGGPRPAIDVTCPPYNADPTGVTLANTAIQAAINAACAIPVTSGRPAVFLPSGVFSVQQTQTGTSTTAPIFTVCRYLTIYSVGSQSTQAQGALNQGALIAVSAGASPNNAPVFLIDGQNGSLGINATLQGFAIQCWNQCVWVKSSSQVIIRDMTMQTGVLQSSVDNTPLKISNTLWVWVEHSILENFNNDSTHNTVILAGETPEGGEQNFPSYITFRDDNLWGGGIQYIQRASTTLNGIPSNFKFETVTDEDSSTPFLNITESSANLLTGIVNVEVDTTNSADGMNNPVINLNVASGYLQNAIVLNSVSAEVNSNSITIQSGGLRNANSVASSSITDINGFPIGGAMTDDSGSYGKDFQSPTNAAPCTDFFYSNCVGVSGGPAVRFYGHNIISQLGLDAQMGVQFGDGVTHGYGAALAQNVLGDLDVETPRLLPPTGFSGTATTGGSLSAGTYYAAIWATQGSSISICPTANFISTLAYSTGVVVGGANNAINFTWAIPQATPISPGGYCLYVSTSLPQFLVVQQGLYISGGASASFLYTGQAFTNLGPIYPQSYMGASSRFGYNWLAVNGLSCASWNFCINGSEEIGSYFDVNEIAAPANPSSGFERWYANNSTHQLSCLTSSGGNCSPSSGGSSIFTSFQQNGTTAITGVNNYYQETWPGIFTTTLTGSGTVGSPYLVAYGLATQNANFVWAGPCTGAAAAPTFRALCSQDIPNNAANTTGNAATATKWATARLLAGNSTDGSANVPFTNKFLVQGTADAGLTGAQFMGALATGIVKNTTTTGVQSIATSSDIIGDFTGTCSISTFLRGDGACAAPSGSGTVNLGTQYAFAEYATSTNAVSSGPTPPAVQGQYLCGYFPTTAAAVAPTCPQVGILPRAVTGTTATDTILYSDNANDVDYQTSVAVATALPTPTTLNNSTFVTRLANHTTGSSTAVTVTATTLTFASSGSTTLVIAQGQTCLLKVDPSGSFWENICSDPPAVAGTNVALIRGSFGLTFSVASAAPSGSAGGGLTGSYPNPTVATVPCSALPAFTGGVTSAGSTCTISQILTNGDTATTQAAGDSSNDVATDSFVSSAIAGVNPAIAVLAATTGSSLTGTYNNGVSGVGATFTITATGAFTLDGVAINTLGQRVLLKDQSSAFQNGIYTATVVGTTGVSPIFTRALDYDQPSDINTTGAIPVQSGTVNASTSWLLTSTVNTVGTDSLTYVQFTLAPANIVTASANFTSGDALKAGGNNKTAADSGLSMPSASGAATVAQTIWSGTFTLNTAAVGSGSCETVVTVSATGVATTDVLSVGFNGDPTAVTGYGASATGAVLSIYPYPTANNVNVKVCNSTANSITPGSMTLNGRVTR